MKMPGDSQSVSANELRPIEATTETATQTETQQPESGAAASPELEGLMAELDAARAELKRVERILLQSDAASDKRMRQIHSDYKNRLIQLEQDLFAERQTNENLSKKIGAQEQSLSDQTKGMRRVKEQISDPATALDKAQSDSDELQRKLQAQESKATGLQQERDELQKNLQASQTLEQQAQSRIAELTAKLEQSSGELKTLRGGAGENDAAQKRSAADLAKERDAHKLSQQKAEELKAQLKRAGDDLAVSRTELEKLNSARKRLEEENRSLTEARARAHTDLAKEHEANKLSRQKVEELGVQLKKLEGAAEKAEAHARESAAQSKDWEKKAAELKKSVDEFTLGQTAQRNVAAQSAQRAKELEQQLKESNTKLSASKTEFEKQNSARQKLESENRSLTEAGGKMKTDLAKEQEANKLSRQKVEEFGAHIKKLQQAAEQAEARIRENASRCSDWEKKAAELKKSVEELTRSQTADRNAAGQSAQRARELEQQLKDANDNLAASRAELEKQSPARQRLEAENHSLTEASAKARAELAESVKSQAALQKRAGELEQRVHEGVSTLAKMTAELQNERAERERAEKIASSATEHLQQLNEKINRHRESERASRAQIAELEKTIHDRGDALARASAALRKESKERHMADKQLRLVSEMGTRLESNLESLEEAKKSFEVSLKQKEERLQTAEGSLAAANSGLEKESAERRRLEGLLAELQRQLEKQSGEGKVEISRLRAALELGELQRKRLEGDLLRSRDVAKNAEHRHGLTLDDLRRELRQPVEDLRQSACRLLESQVTDEQKRVVETVLEKALFLQVSLNATAKPESPAHSPADTQRADSRNKKGGSK